MSNGLQTAALRCAARGFARDSIHFCLHAQRGELLDIEDIDDIEIAKWRPPEDTPGGRP